MKDQVVQEIIMALKPYDLPIEDNTLKSVLYMALKDVQIKPAETAIVVGHENKNEWFIKRFLIIKTVAGLSKRTLEYYEKEIRRFLYSVGKPADQVTADDIRYYLACKDQIDGWSKTTQNNVLRNLKSFFGTLQLEEIIPRNPCAKINQIKEHKAPKQAFTEIEIEKMRGAIKSSREKVMFEMLLSTGCRASEMAAIKIKDIEENKVTVLGKGNKERTCYLNVKAQLALKEYLNDRRDENPYLFPLSVAKLKRDDPATHKLRKVRENWYKHPVLVSKTEPSTRDTVNATMKKVAKRAGVEGAHAHRFRRTAATFALRRGMPILQVSKMLGHENINTTQIYLDIDEKDLERAHEKYVL